MSNASSLVIGLTVICATVVALAFIGHGEIIDHVIVSIGNLIVSVATMFRVEQTKQATEEIKERVNGNGKAHH